jgi:hypothetical protein
MPTGKYKKKNKKTDDISPRGAVHNIVVSMANGNDKDERDVPWSLLIAVVVLCLVLVIALPVMGLMYMDMNNATNAAIVEIDRMRRLRNLILRELEEKNANSEPTQTTPAEEPLR